MKARHGGDGSGGGARDVAAIVPREASAARPRDAVRYEAYGPGGSVLLVECSSEDSTRMRAGIRRVLETHGAALAAAGAIAYLFNPVGLLAYPPGTDEECLMKVALASGAEDVVSSDDGSVEVLTDPRDFAQVRRRLSRARLEPEAAAVTWRASLLAPLDAEAGERLLRLVAALEELDDVQSVYTNAAVPDEVLARV